MTFSKLATKLIYTGFHLVRGVICLRMVAFVADFGH
jgi:hypothetical protein